MGQLSEAIFFYGTSISYARLAAFRSALASLGKLGDLDTEAPLEPGDSSLIDLRDAVQGWLDASDHPFDVYSNFDENGNGDLESAEIVLRYSPKDGKEDGGCSVGKWGYQTTGSKFTCVPEPWADRTIVEEAKQAFKKLGEDPVIKEASIDLELYWILGVDIG